LIFIALIMSNTTIAERLRRRKRGETPAQAEEYIPVELLIDICGYLYDEDALSIADISEFRRLSKETAAAGMDVLRDRCTKLYLHPTRLEDVITLCKHPNMLKNVSEIVVLGASAPAMCLPSTFTEHEDQRLIHLNNHPWPPLDGKASTSKGKVGEKLFEEDYQELLQALKALGLNKVKVLHYAGCPVGPGWLQVSKDFIDQTGDLWLDWRNTYDGPDQPSSNGVVRWSDAEMVEGLLSSLPFHFAKLVLEQPLPYTSHSRIHYSRLEHSPDGMSFAARLLHAAQHLTSVTITIPGTKGHMLNTWRFLDHLPALHELEVRIVSEVDEEYKIVSGLVAAEWTARPRWESVESGFPPRPGVFVLPTLSSSRLQSLRIVGYSEHSDPLCANALVALLRSHQETFRTVESSNVLFSDTGGGYYGYAAIPMDMVGRCLMQEMTLDSLQYALRRFECPARPASTNDDMPNARVNRSCGDYGLHAPRCHQYKGMDRHWYPAPYIEEVMRSWRIPLADDGWWRLSIQTASTAEVVEGS
jgi:hypothetical protein